MGGCCGEWCRHGLTWRPAYVWLSVPNVWLRLMVTTAQPEQARERSSERVYIRITQRSELTEAAGERAVGYVVGEEQERWYAVVV